MSERIVNVHPKVYKEKAYRSTLEAETAKTLDAIGIPFQYEERKIELIEGFRSPFQKDKVRSVTYTPDFIIGPLMIECKGFETPEWKLKKKLVFKWLQENEPDTLFYMIKNTKQLLQALDNHWSYLGYCVQVTSKPAKSKKVDTEVVQKCFDSIAQAMSELNLGGKSIAPIIRSLTGKKEYVFGYKWTLIKIEL